MKVTEIELRGFTAFEGATFSFAPGINVLIGENGTGKSHVLKALYALLTTARPGTTLDEMGELLRDELAAVFRPDGKQSGRLIRFDAERAQLWLKAERGETLCLISQEGDTTVSEPTRWDQAPGALFIPSRDALAMFEGFVHAYKRRELSFDKTFHDICEALGGEPLRGKEKSAADKLAANALQDLLQGTVALSGTQFYIDFGDGAREAHLVAEGLRKIAMLVRLVQNGSIKPGGILLWDEPEANLNPRLISAMADVLRNLAAGGVQIFLATHDYLLSHKLSLAAEYSVAPKVEMQFFSLYHDRVTDPVEVECGATLAEIAHNGILDEFARYYDWERALFRGERPSDRQGDER